MRLKGSWTPRAILLFSPRGNELASQRTVGPSGIYFRPLSAPRTVCFFDFATRKTREVFKTDRDFGDGLSVSSDGRYILHSQLDENNSSIMLVNNFR